VLVALLVFQLERLAHLAKDLLEAMEQTRLLEFAVQEAVAAREQSAATDQQP
jgi:Sec-independent protein translocase protein TatA